MPTQAQIEEIETIVVQGVFEQKQNNHVQITAGDGGGSWFSDGRGHYFVERPQWFQNMIDYFEGLAADDDGDGVSNIFDKLHGYDDNVPQIDGSNGGILAEISPGVWGYFIDGVKTAQSYRVTGATFTDGSPDVEFGVSKDGFNFSYHGGDSMVYELEPITGSNAAVVDGFYDMVLL